MVSGTLRTAPGQEEGPLNHQLDSALVSRSCCVIVYLFVWRAGSTLGIYILVLCSTKEATLFRGSAPANHVCTRVES